MKIKVVKGDGRESVERDREHTHTHTHTHTQTQRERERKREGGRERLRFNIMQKDTQADLYKKK